MIKKYCIALSLTALSAFLGSCQQRVFGVDEAIWSSLSEQEREKVIDGYNKRREMELVHAQKQKEQELEKIHYHLDTDGQSFSASSSWGNSNHRSSFFSLVRIQSISSNKGRQVLTIGDEQFEISLFSRMSHAWVKGQKVELTKNDSDLLYPVTIRNVENGESVAARKSRRP